MTVYNINLGIGWASSGVEYAQAYRSTVFNHLGIDAKFVFTDFISQDNICDLTRNLGFKDDQIIWLYTFFTDQKIAPTTYTLADLQQDFNGELSRIDRQGNVARLFYDDQDVFLTAYFKSADDDIVKHVEYVSRGNLIRKDFFSYTKSFTEYYTPREGKAHLYQRRYFNEDGSVAYDEIIDGNTSIYRLEDSICYSKEALVELLMKRLQLQSNDVVILDRSTGVGQAVFKTVKPAKLGVVVHAEHFSANAVTDHTILWNNYYDYQFTNADKVDFFITATDKQKEVLAQQFEIYTKHRPYIVTIPVGSLDSLHYPKKSRRPFSVITASRLATEKHVDWLVKAVIEARKVIPQLTFDIYGAGGEETKIRHIIETNMAQDYIRLCGHRDLTEVYQNYELYLSASKSEGFGLTLLEAVGSGLPLIGFDVRYGNQTFIRDKDNGYLIPAFDTDDESAIVAAFARKIIAFFNRPDRDAMQANSYDIARHFLTNEVEKKWQNLMKEMTRND